MTGSWAERWEGASCTQVGDHDIFFPDKGGSAADAKRVCRGCPLEIRTECLAFALEQHIPEGVFGGLAPRERRKLRRES